MSEKPDLFKELIWDNLVRAGIAYLFTALPFLNIPILRNIISALITFALDQFYGFSKLFVDMTMIKITNESLEREYDRASTRLYILAQERGIDSPEFKESRNAHREVLSQFVRFGVAR